MYLTWSFIIDDMNCPSCDKNVSKALNQFGITKTCEFCHAKFKIQFKWKEILIYVLIVGAICGLVGGFIENEYLPILIIVVSFPMSMKYLYMLPPTL